MTMIEHTPQRTPDRPFESEAKPDQADFAVLDLAQQDEGPLLGWLYSHFKRKEIPWAALYLGSKLNASWQSGPVLIELRAADDFRKALLERYQSEYLGLLIDAPDTGFAQMKNHLRSLVTVTLDSNPSIFRFYDPRCVGSLFEALEPAQQLRITGPAQRWSWYQHHCWRMWDAPAATLTPLTEKPLVISGVQRIAMDTARRRQFARSLTHIYSAHIPANDAEAFVIAELHAAETAGLSQHADQERWLRMALYAQGPLRESPRWRQVAQNSNQTPIQILSQLECDQGCDAC